MDKLTHFNSIPELHEKSGFETPNHPLISLMTCHELMCYSIGQAQFTGDFFMVALKKIKEGHVLYGKTKYDHDSGSMVFTKPRQKIEVTNVMFAERGFVIFFHENYLSGHIIFEQIKKYGFFDYEINEALHLSTTEEGIMWKLYDSIRAEYDNNPDEFSREIILSHIDSILKYSDRFYRRQFADRSLNLSGTTVKKFQSVLENYFEKGLHISVGLPNANYLATELNLSTRYLSDVLKKETGKTTLDHIHIHLIKEAKNQLVSSDNNVAGIAYDLGFESPSYFIRLFKKIVGVTPLKYKEQSKSSL